MGLGEGVNQGGEVVGKDVDEVVCVSMKLSCMGVFEDGGGRGLIMILENESVGVPRSGGQPVPKGLLGCVDGVLSLCSSDVFEHSVGTVDGLCDLCIGWRACRVSGEV